MIEPTIIAQTAECKTPAEKRAWAEWHVAFGKRHGIVFARLTEHTAVPDLLLYEGWTQRPDDQGEPRFQIDVTRN